MEVRGHGVRARGVDGKNATTPLEAILSQGQFSRACAPPLSAVSGLAMGSYGNAWLRCSWCGRWGQCARDVVDGPSLLTQIDGDGLLCETCEVRDCPPHYNYLWWLVRSKLSVQATWLIANYAYPACVKSGSVWQTLCQPTLPAYPLYPPLPPGMQQPGSGSASGVLRDAISVLGSRVCVPDPALQGPPFVPSSRPIYTDVLRDGIWVPASVPPTPKCPSMRSTAPSTLPPAALPSSAPPRWMSALLSFPPAASAPAWPSSTPPSSEPPTDIRLQQPGSGSLEVMHDGILLPASEPPAPKSSQPAASAPALPSSRPLGCAMCRFSTSGCNRCRGIGFIQCRLGKHRSPGAARLLFDGAAARPPSTPLAPPPLQAGCSKCRYSRSGCRRCN